jgi:hypothetical protein
VMKIQVGSGALDFRPWSAAPAARSARHRKPSGAPKLPTSPRRTGKKKDAEPSRLINNNGRQETKMETWRPNLAHPDGLDFPPGMMNLQVLDVSPAP